MERSIVLTRLDEQGPAALATWFADGESQRRLGGMLPLQGWFARMRTSPGRYEWLALVRGRPVGLVSVEVYADKSASVALLIDPARRRQGYGTHIMRAVLARPEVARLARVEAGIEVDNLAGRRCAEAAGFVLLHPEPDGDGFLTLVYYPTGRGEDRE
jgi:RimJ/RimL family protein N-acetyltransferase